MPIGWAKSRSPSALIAGIVAAGLVWIGMTALPAASRTALHERIFDTLLALAAPLRPGSASVERIVVVDIDAQSLAAYGGWPWPRSLIADLVEAIGHSGAAAVAIDILFEGPDAKSPAALAHRLGTEIGRTDINTWADTLPDGDRRLGEVLASVPVALGFALDPTGTAKLPGMPFLTRGAVVLPQLWRAPGGIAPFADLLDHAAGLGALALPGDGDGMVRRVPMLVSVGGQVHPGLATEAVRLAQHASAYQLDGTGEILGIGGVRVRLPPDGMLRLIPGHAFGTVVATISASDLLREKRAEPRLRRAIVLIGSSAPELGGLRPTPDDPLMPSVTILAMAVDQLLRGRLPLAISHEYTISWVLGLVATIAGLLAALLLRPVHGGLAVGCVVILMAGAAFIAAIGDRMFDPLVPMMLAATSFAIASREGSTNAAPGGTAPSTFRSTSGTRSGGTNRLQPIDAQIEWRTSSNYRPFHRY